MKINARLKKIGDLVEANSFCLDVGCDHALLDIYLVHRNKNIKAVASDIAEGPLEQAKKNIKRERLDDKIETRLGNGLSTYTDEIDTVIISGMGGRNIIGICKENLKVLKKIKTLIISPNNYQIDVKKYLTKNGFYIDNEEFVKDKNFIYQIIILKRGIKKYTKKEYFFGPKFLEKKGPLFREYYLRELKSKEILKSMLPSKYRLKRYQLKKEIELIKNEIED
jgi:tRNA (adenine22-N1)-methyltransferase